VVAHATKADEAAWVAAECRRLHDQGVPWNELAVLYRINARSPEFESAMTDAGVPFVVTSGAFLSRSGPRGVLRGLEHRRAELDVTAAVRAMAERMGWRPEGAAKSSDEAQTLQEDLSRLLSIATDDDFNDVGEYIDAIRERFDVRIDGDGVELLTMHRAKGLEWRVVFLPRLNAKELPFRSRTSAADEGDERRLLYVGITRAKRRIYLSRAADAGAPSSFLAELGIVTSAATKTASTSSRSRSGSVELDDSDPIVAALRTWRSEESRRIGKPAYVVFDNKTLAAIVAAAPSTLAELAQVTGVGPAKLERYGEAVLDVVRAAKEG
jgi:DNA helicase-2/ATP-dependent DNA helicase PcrA